MSREKSASYPAWVCWDCGKQYGKRVPWLSTWNVDTCGVCGETKDVTEPRDFGHLKEGWQERAKRQETDVPAEG